MPVVDSPAWDGAAGKGGHSPHQHRADYLDDSPMHDLVRPKERAVYGPHLMTGVVIDFPAQTPPRAESPSQQHSPDFGGGLLFVLYHIAHTPPFSFVGGCVEHRRFQVA